MNDPRDPVQLDQPLPPPPAAPAPEVVEDAGSRALAEALRSSFVIVKVIMVLLAVLFLGSGLTTVGTQEKAVILRFGRPVGEGEDALLGPGFHWAWPPPIDEVVKIPIGQVQTVQSTIGWYATTAAREACGCRAARWRTQRVTYPPKVNKTVAPSSSQGTIRIKVACGVRNSSLAPASPPTRLTAMSGRICCQWRRSSSSRR